MNDDFSHCLNTVFYSNEIYSGIFFIFSVYLIVVLSILRPSDNFNPQPQLVDLGTNTPKVNLYNTQDFSFFIDLLSVFDFGMVIS